MGDFIIKCFVFLLFFNTNYSQKKDTIRVGGEIYIVREILLLYTDTIYLCDKKTSFRYTKDSIYIYKPRYYKKYKKLK